MTEAGEAEVIRMTMVAVVVVVETMTIIIENVRHV